MNGCLSGRRRALLFALLDLICEAMEKICMSKANMLILHQICSPLIFQLDLSSLLPSSYFICRPIELWAIQYVIIFR